MKRRSSKAMFMFHFPTGATLRLSSLEWKNLQTLQDQCAPRDIDKLVSLDSGVEYFLDMKRKGGVFSSGGSPFQSADGQSPVHGAYRVVLKENLEIGVEASICGSLCEWISVPGRQQRAREKLGSQLRLYLETCPSSETNYSIAVIGEKLYVTLDHSAHRDKLLTVKSPQKIIATTSMHPYGGICGQIFLFAQIIPYALMLHIAELFKVSKVVFTGEGWSGSIAHASAIMFRELFNCIDNPPAVAAISFSGPLCATSKLSEYLANSGQKENHVTINCGSAILDRLLANYQRLSAFADSDIGSWKSMYQPFHDSLVRYMEGNFPLDLESLQQAEDILHNHKLSEQNNLLPIGYFMRRDDHEPLLVPSEEMLDSLGELMSFEPLAWRPFYSLLHENVATWDPAPAAVVDDSYMPRVTDVFMICTPTKFTIHFEGTNLDCVQKRLMEAELSIAPETINKLPFRVKLDRFSFQSQDAKLTKVQCFPNKAVIELSGVHLKGPGSISLVTDFGETKAFSYAENKIINRDDSSLAKSLHPTMNAEFLSSALLRVAIMANQTGTGIEGLKEQNPSIYDLWCILLDLEENIFEMQLGLSKYMNQYLTGKISIGDLKKMCLEKFEEMSRQATLEAPLEKDHAVYRGMKVVAGGLLAVTGGLLTLAGILLSVPAIILAIPAKPLIDRGRERGYNVGTIAYMGVVGVTALPAAIVAVFGVFLAGAASHALSDYSTHSYKELLKNIITLLGGNPLEVVDELPQQEDYVVALLQKMFPGIDVAHCTDAEFRARLEEGKEKKDEGIINFEKALEKYPLFFKKVQMVGRIYAMRQILLGNLMIGFVGVHNAGKSTTISKLWELDTNPHILVRTEEPVPHFIGNWVDSYAQKYPRFNEWLQAKHRNSTQLYAVDFPGTTDERESIRLMTSHTAELVSMFVVVLKAGHIAGPEKEVVDLVKLANKPFIVLVNHCDSIAGEMKKPGYAESLHSHYAEVLDISPGMLHFACAKHPSSNDKLRGLLFGMIQTLLCNKDIVKALALRLTPPSAVANLEESIINLPEELATAAYSLMFNLSAVRRETLESTCRSLVRDATKSEDRQIGKMDVNNVVFKTMDGVRLLAILFDLDSSEYETCMLLVERRNQAFKPHFDQIDQALENANEQIEFLVLNLALVSLRNDLFEFMKMNNAPNDSDLSSLVTQVLIGFKNILNHWVSVDCKKEAVLRAILTTFDSLGSKDESAFFNKIRGYEERLKLQNSQPAAEGDNDVDEIRVSLIGEELDFEEFNRYRLGKDRLEKLNSFTYRICDVEAHQIQVQQGDVMSEISHFREASQKYIDKHHTNVFAFQLPRDQGILMPLLNILGQLTKEHLDTGNFRFTLEDDPAIDVNGVSRALLSKAAQEIANNPEQVFMRVEKDTNFLYFDPDRCLVPTNPVEMGKVLNTMHNFGRLIGLVLMKHNTGASLSLNFPLTVYKILLGMKLSVNDLYVFNPTVVTSLQKLCPLDNDTLEGCCLSFVVALKDAAGETFELCKNGEARDVTADNILEYMYHYVRYRLCIVDDFDGPNPLFALLLGLQDMCPRELFRELTPVAMQLIVAGSTEPLDVEQWKIYSTVTNKAAANIQALDWFWEVVSEMSELDKRRLLAFATGTAILPAKGFEDLSSPFTIEINAVISENALPYANTCFFKIVLPRYSSKSLLQDKLLLAIRETDVGTFGMA